MIHRFNDEGMASLDPRWAGGRPRRITADGEDFIVGAATTRPEALGLPFTRWSLRKLAAYLGDDQTRVVKISAERLRQILAARGVTFQRTKTWKESNDPERDAKLDRIEEVLGAFPRRCFAFDQFGPLTIRPVAGAGWALAGRPPLMYRALRGLGPEAVRSLLGAVAGVRSCLVWVCGCRGQRGVVALVVHKARLA